MKRLEIIIHKDGTKSLLVEGSLLDADIPFIVNERPTHIVVKSYSPWELGRQCGLREIVKALWIQDRKTPSSLALSFPWVESLHLCSDATEIDFGVFQNLTELNIANQRCIPETLSRCGRLRCLSVSNSKMHNFREVCGDLELTKLVLDRPGESCLMAIPLLRELRHIGIAHSQTRDLDFLSRCVLLEYLSIAYMPMLESLSGVEAHGRLWNVDISNSPRLEHLEPLSSLQGLRQLLLDSCPRVASLRPLLELRKLERLMLWERTIVADGDLKCMLRSPKLREVSFQNRRHYNITLSELLSELGANRDS